MAIASSEIMRTNSMKSNFWHQMECWDYSVEANSNCTIECNQRFSLKHRVQWPQSLTEANTNTLKCPHTNVHFVVYVCCSDWTKNKNQEKRRKGFEKLITTTTTQRIDRHTGHLAAHVCFIIYDFCILYSSLRFHSLLSFLSESAHNLIILFLISEVVEPLNIYWRFD